MAAASRSSRVIRSRATRSVRDFSASQLEPPPPPLVSAATPLGDRFRGLSCLGGSWSLLLLLLGDDGDRGGDLDFGSSCCCGVGGGCCRTSRAHPREASDVLGRGKPGCCCCGCEDEAMAVTVHSLEREREYVYF